MSFPEWRQQGGTGPDPVKLGKGDRLVDPRTGQEVAGSAEPAVDPVEQERRKAAARARGKVEGEREGEKPKKTQQSEFMLDTLDEALGDWEAVKHATGPVGSWIPNLTGTAQRGQSRIDQLLGQTFMQAYQDLKGGGQITENETRQAVDAYTRLQTPGMNDEDYRQAMFDLREVAVKGLRRSKGLSTDDDVIQSLSNAYEAIQSGKSRERVIQRLRENGIDPTGL